MRIDPGKMKAHADARLGDATAPGGQRIASFRRVLKLEADRLRMRHRFGLGGREITRGRSHLVDIVVRRACQMAADDLGNAARPELVGLAVVGVGGYGRQELAPFSDVDLLILRPGRASSAVQAFVETVLPLLWDVGLEIGHSFRSVAECVAMGRTDLHARNAMAEARLVTGSPDLFRRFQGEMDRAVYGNTNTRPWFLRQVLAEQVRRLERFGGAVCVQEPNTKENAGGLRDVHVVVWIAHTLFGCHDIDRLREIGRLSVSEHARVRRAYDFISRARNEAHFQTGRRSDVLSLGLQPGVAEGLGYEAKGGLEASEIFMRDYYRSALELRRFNERFLLRTGALEPPRPLRRFQRRSRRVGAADRYEVRGGELFANDDSPDFGGHALAILEAFEISMDEGVPLSDELRHEIRARIRLVDRAFRDSDAAAARFLSLLARDGAGHVLRSMHDTGFLGRYLPPFRRISMLVQHDQYHRYTVDEHTLRAVEAVDALARPGSTPSEAGIVPDRLALALDEVVHRQRLVLALLLHDIGKGGGGGHAARGARIARRVCERLGLDDDATSDVVFLVRKHLVMSHVSQRRDLSDPAVLGGFRETVGTLDRLNMLFVLTHADTAAVGPGVWTGWKASLLTKLYERVRADLQAGDLTPPESDQRVRREETVVANLTPEYLRSDVQSFLEGLPDRYLRAVPSDLIARHFRMVHDLGTHTLLTDWTAVPPANHAVLSACLRDAPGVLARLAGILTGAGFDILSVEAFTRPDGVALDVFTLAEADGSPGDDAERWRAVDGQLVAALEGRLDVEAAVARRWSRLSWSRKRKTPGRPEVRLEPPDALGRTVIEVRADDQPGLVFRITDCMSRIGLDISFAKIATEKDRALDFFYVTRAGGEPVSPAEAPEVEARLVDALTRDWPPSP
jgi:[protein-PII] uridylyltransferase